MLFQINNNIQPVLYRIFAQLAYDREILRYNVPYRFTLILSFGSLYQLKKCYRGTRSPLGQNIRHMGEVKYMGFDLSIEGAHNWPDDKIALIRNQDLIPKGPGEVIFKDFYPYVYTRPEQIRPGDGMSWLEPDYYQYVTVAQFEKKGGATVIDKSFLWYIELTGSRWCIVQEEHFIPFEYAVCVYEPDYYRYMFAVLPFDVAIRFCSDHALEKLQISINEAARKNL